MLSVEGADGPPGPEFRHWVCQMVVRRERIHEEELDHTSLEAIGDGGELLLFRELRLEGGLRSEIAGVLGEDLAGVEELRLQLVPPGADPEAWTPAAEVARFLCREVRLFARSTEPPLVAGTFVASRFEGSSTWSGIPSGIPVLPIPLSQTGGECRFKGRIPIHLSATRRTWFRDLQLLVDEPDDITEGESQRLPEGEVPDARLGPPEEGIVLEPDRTAPDRTETFFLSPELRRNGRLALWLERIRRTPTAEREGTTLRASLRFLPAALGWMPVEVCLVAVPHQPLLLTSAGDAESPKGEPMHTGQVDDLVYLGAHGSTRPDHTPSIEAWVHNDNAYPVRLQGRARTAGGTGDVPLAFVPVPPPDVVRERDLVCVQPHFRTALRMVLTEPDHFLYSKEVVCRITLDDGTDGVGFQAVVQYYPGRFPPDEIAIDLGTQVSAAARSACVHPDYRQPKRLEVNEYRKGGGGTRIPSLATRWRGRWLVGGTTIARRKVQRPIHFAKLLLLLQPKREVDAGDGGQASIQEVVREMLRALLRHASAGIQPRRVWVNVPGRYLCEDATASDRFSKLRRLVDEAVAVEFEGLAAPQVDYVDESSTAAVRTVEMLRSVPGRRVSGGDTALHRGRLEALLGEEASRLCFCGDCGGGSSDFAVVLLRLRQQRRRQRIEVAPVRGSQDSQIQGGAELSRRLVLLLQEMVRERLEELGVDVRHPEIRNDLDWIATNELDWFYGEAERLKPRISRLQWARAWHDRQTGSAQPSSLARAFEGDWSPAPGWQPFVLQYGSFVIVRFAGEEDAAGLQDPPERLAKDPYVIGPGDVAAAFPKGDFEIVEEALRRAGNDDLLRTTIGDLEQVFAKEVNEFLVERGDLASLVGNYLDVLRPLPEAAAGRPHVFLTGGTGQWLALAEAVGELVAEADWPEAGEDGFVVVVNPDKAACSWGALTDPTRKEPSDEAAPAPAVNRWRLYCQPPDDEPVPLPYVAPDGERLPVEGEELDLLLDDVRYQDHDPAARSLSLRLELRPKLARVARDPLGDRVDYRYFSLHGESLETLRRLAHPQSKEDREITLSVSYEKGCFVLCLSDPERGRESTVRAKA